ncbi:MAG: 23S rRNA (pseudouridine(1915)-N(3))-methyltransferase RlmH [SAR86 cluster bacterium]|uniref:Ribosomal RNA large subunit methyltransferase H n=1 Tax=SAR86 cluster bacterium TaxID=2030880 RepID=A0A2A5AL13_9GAMM|nr:MAG: 23S rRNA (pseudouridine(1915)-N(3))-methyltransferase RlmH [SAR86 cluster bacterium]
MKVKLFCVGTKMPSWVQLGVADYAKRIVSDLGFSIIEIPMAKRSKTTSMMQCIKKEGDALLAAVNHDDYIVAMDVLGKSFHTETLAQKIGDFRRDGRNLSLLIGGPDGLSAECLSKADERWSLSALTLPHPLVRVLLTEQLYRASSILKGHPYHRA